MITFMVDPNAAGSTSLQAFTTHDPERQLRRTR